MATATIARPAQALRNRRDPPRLSLTNKRQTTMDGSSEAPTTKRRKLDEPYVRTSAYILKKHSGKPPSLTIHLHQTHFRFDGQDGSFAYDSPMRFIIQHLRKQTVPHEMLEELLANNVPFYDGCLIVEVHNHRAKESKQKGKNDGGPGPNGVTKFSMHKYNEHITPSPMVPYPSKARSDTAGASAVKEESKEERGVEQDGPKISTLVLHPTPLTLHHEMLILAKTPSSDLKSKRAGGDGATPSGTQPPPTPQLSVPPTPITQTARPNQSQSTKMSLEESDFYTFEAEVLVATEPPLYLEPVDNFEDSQKVIQMLQHPLHQEAPPSPKTRKRTTAEMAADDAQAAEIERRMLIMDERIKASGTNAAANENQQAAASLGFSRFNTLEMVRQQHEEKERAKKDEEARLALEKKQQEELAQQQQRALAQQNTQRQAMLAQQAQQAPNQAQMLMHAQRDHQMRARMAQQQMNAANAQQANIMANQQMNFAHGNQANMQQAASIARNQTPMINSSPVIAQNGFPMVATTSQGPAGSPPRPTSATLPRQHPMNRQISQQQHPSRNGTPQLPHGTPNMGQAMINRQVTQTPRMQPSSPAVAIQQGTPTSASMHVQTPQMNNLQNLTPDQQLLWAQRLQMGQKQAGMAAGSPQQQNMTPEQFQQLTNVQRQLMQAQAHAQAQAQAQGQPPMTPQQYAAHAAAVQNRQRQQLIQRQHALLAQQQQQQLQAQAQMNSNTPMQGGAGVQAGSPGSIAQQTPQMGHTMPQAQQQQDIQMTPQQQQQAAMNHARAQHARNQAITAQIQPLIQKYGNLLQIPPQVLATMQPQLQHFIRVNQMKIKMQVQQQQQMLQQQQQQNGQIQQAMGQSGQEQVPGGTPNPQFMQHLRNQSMLSRAQMAQQQQQQQQQAPQQQQQQHQQQQHQTGMHNAFNMGSMAMGTQFDMQQGGQVNGNTNLNQHFAKMQNALNPQGGNGGAGGAGGMQ